jgi:hypothetical protein
MFKINLPNKPVLYVESFDKLNGSQRQEIADEFVRTRQCYNMTTEVEFILSMEHTEHGQDAPFTREDCGLDESWGEIELEGEHFQLTEEERDEKIEEYQEKLDSMPDPDNEDDLHQLWVESYEERRKAGPIDFSTYIEDYEEFLSEVSDELYDERQEVQDIIDELESLDCYEHYPEVYQWFLCPDIVYWLKDEVTLNNEYWGRQACGQSITLDHCIQKAAFDCLSYEVSEDEYKAAA